MTKKDFISVWTKVEGICKKKVNSQVSISAFCQINPCPNSYRLVLKPNVLMWPDELCAIVGLVGMLGLSLYFNFSKGSIEIF